MIKKKKKSHSQEQNHGCRDKYLAKLGQHKRILDFESEILLDAGNFLTKQALAHIIIFIEKKTICCEDNKNR